MLIFYNSIKIKRSIEFSLKVINKMDVMIYAFHRTFKIFIVLPELLVYQSDCKNNMGNVLTYFDC